eukprot:gene2315-2536_t
MAASNSCAPQKPVRIRHYLLYGILLLAFWLFYWFHANWDWIERESFVWQYTTLAEWIRPVAREGCAVSPRRKTLPPQERKKLRIGMVLIYGKFGQSSENTWSEEVMAPILQNRRDYCAIHNYTMINAKDLVDLSRPVSWSKLLAMDHHFTSDSFDYLFYIDMDIVIMNFSIPLEKFIEDDGYEHDFILTHDWNGVNFGVWMAKNTPWTLWFLRTAWNQSQLVPPFSAEGIAHPFDYEQRAVHYLLNTQAWRNTGLKRYPGNSSAIRSHFQILPQCAFNSYTVHPFDLRGSRETAQYKKGDFLVHFAGKRGYKKLKLMDYYLSRVNKSPPSSS